jgi:hypothetical protein
MVQSKEISSFDGDFGKAPIEDMRLVVIVAGLNAIRKGILTVAQGDERENHVELAHRIRDEYMKNPILALPAIDEILILGPRATWDHEGCPFLQIIFDNELCTWYPRE